MKWLNRILGKEEIPSTVAFGEIDSWLEVASKLLFHGLSTNAEQLYEEITVLSFYEVTASNVAFVFGKSSKSVYYVRLK